jgi:glutamate synthase domain-containing protein 1
MVAGINGDYVYLSSEESAMRLVSPQLNKFWAPRGGEPVVARLKNMSPKTLEALAGGQIQ